MPSRLYQVTLGQLLWQAMHHFRHEFTTAILYCKVAIVMALLDLLGLLLSTVIISILLHRKELFETLAQICVMILFHVRFRRILWFLTGQKRCLI